GSPTPVRRPAAPLQPSPVANASTCCSPVPHHCKHDPETWAQVFPKVHAPINSALVEAHQKPVQRGAMRPSLLDPLFAALTTLPGVGPKLEKLYRRLFGREDTPARIVDLLFHLPVGTIDRRSRPKLRDVVPGSVVTVAVTVD